MVALLCAVSSPGSADAADAGRGESSAAVKRLAQAGRRAYANKRWANALAAFEAAWEADPQPRFLYNVGRCHEQLGDYPKALEALRRYLDDAEDGDDRADAQTVLAMVRRKLLATRGRVQIVTRPAGAAARITRGDRTVDGETPFEAWLELGGHVVVVERDGYRTERARLTVKAGETERVELELRPGPRGDGDGEGDGGFGSDREAAGAAGRTSGDAGVGPWVAVGVGAALLGGGAVFAVLTGRAREDRDALEGSPRPLPEIQEAHDRAESRATTANVMFAAGAVAVAVGAVWWMVGGRAAAARAVGAPLAGSGPEHLRSAYGSQPDLLGAKG